MCTFLKLRAVRWGKLVNCWSRCPRMPVSMCLPRYISLVGRKMKELSQKCARASTSIWNRPWKSQPWTTLQHPWQRWPGKTPTSTKSVGWANVSASGASPPTWNATPSRRMSGSSSILPLVRVCWAVLGNFSSMLIRWPMLGSSRRLLFLGGLGPIGRALLLGLLSRSNNRQVSRKIS